MRRYWKIKLREKGYTMKKQINQLRAGVILSYINLALGSIIPMLYTPVMLKLLGQSEYGLYSLSNSVISYLSLLSFGLGGTIIRYIAKYRAENDKNSIEKLFGFSIKLFCGLAVVVLIVGFIITFNVETIFHRGLTAKEIDKVHILVFIMTINTALSFPNSVFSSVILAYERYVFRRVVDMFSTVIAPLVNIVVLYLGYASVGMSLVSTIIQILMLCVNIFYCIEKMRISPKRGRLSGDLIKEIFKFSAYSFLGSIVDMLFWSTDKVILGMLASSIAVAVYNVGGTFNNIVMNLSTSISGVLMPKITGMVVKEAKGEELTELFIRVGRLQYIIIALVVSGFIVFGRSFIILWAGSEYINAYWIAILTLFPLCIPLIQNTGVSIVVAQNKHKFRSIVYLLIAILNVISTYCVVPYWGEIGAAFCSCISYLLGQGIIMNWFYYKKIGIDIPSFWRNIASMSVIPGGMLMIGIVVFKKIEVLNWSVFFIGVAVYTLVYCAGMYIFSLNNYEKDIIRKPLVKWRIMKEK